MKTHSGENLKCVLAKIVEERKKEVHANGPLEKMKWAIGQQRAIVKQNQQALEDESSWQHSWARFMSDNPELGTKMTFGHRVHVNLVNQRHVKCGEEAPTHLIPLLVIEQKRRELKITSHMMSEEEWESCLNEIIQKGIPGSPYNWGEKDLTHLKTRPTKTPKVFKEKRMKGPEAKQKMITLLTAAKEKGIKIIIGKVAVQKIDVKNLDSHKMNWSKCIRTSFYSPMHETREMKQSPSTGKTTFHKEPTPELDQEMDNILQAGVSREEAKAGIKKGWKSISRKSEKKTSAPRIVKRCAICKNLLDKDIEMYAPKKLEHEKNYHGTKYFKLEEIKKNDNAWYPVIKILMP